MKRVKEKFSPYFNIVVAKRSDRTRAYFIIDPDGSVFIPINDGDSCREIKIGNIFDKDIFERWKTEVSKNKYINNTLRDASVRDT